MLAIATDLVSRAVQLILGGAQEPALWTVSVRGRVVGSLIFQAGSWRLSWFDGADRRLVGFEGAFDGDVEALAAVLTARLGAPVELASLAV